MAPKFICISSGKGGVGKTSLSVNIAAALARAGKKVLLVDGDLGLANVDVVLGINVRHTLQEIIEEGRAPASILVGISENFKVLPASSGVPEMANLAYEEQAFLMETLEGVSSGFDFVLVDTAAGIGESVLWFNNWTDENIIILTADPTSLTDAYALIKVLASKHNKANFHLLINSVKSRKEGEGIFKSFSLVLEKFLQIKPQFTGAIPFDNHVAQAIRQQQPFLNTFPECRAGQAVTSIAEKIIAEF